jgi:cobalamin synthase
MRDSRIGSYGALALVMSLGLRWTALVGMGGSARVVAGLAAAVVGFGLARLGTRQIGGHSGDLLGATSVVVECVVLSVLVAAG